MLSESLTLFPRIAWFSSLGNLNISFLFPCSILGLQWRGMLCFTAKIGLATMKKFAGVVIMQPGQFPYHHISALLLIMQPMFALACI